MNFGTLLHTNFDEMKDQVAEYLDPSDSEDPDDSEEVAAGIIEIEEKRLGRKLTKKERQRILDSVTPER